MKLTMHPSAYGSTASTNQGYQNLTQAFTMLHAEDPVFSNAVHPQHFERGQLVAAANDLANRMYVLMNGKVNMVCTNNEGRRLVIATLEPGAVFGEGAFENPGGPNVFVEAVDQVSVLEVPAGEARNLTMQYPILGWGLLQTYGARLFQVENSLENVAYKKLPERLASLLIDLADEATETIKGVSHQALADHLGTYRETVSAILRDFKRQGLVELRYRRITLVDSETLRDIAGIWD